MLRQNQNEKHESEFKKIQPTIFRWAWFGNKFWKI